MKVGDKITCPACGEHTVVKIKTTMDDWTVLGEILICTLCEVKLGDVKPDLTQHEKSTSAKGSLVALLGDIDEPTHPQLSLSEQDRRFCRICSHCIAHPFFLKCELTQKEVDPMSDCNKFQPKPKTD